jgi:hypothetical protein
MPGPARESAPRSSDLPRPPTPKTTDVLVSDLRQLDVPETDVGNQAKSELDNLGTRLTQLVDTVQQALDANTGVVALASTVGTALSTATNDVKSTLDEFQDPAPAS